MGNELRTRARRVLLQQIAPAYHDASGSQKQQMLEEFVSATGYARKYALWLLHHAEEVFSPTSAVRRRYGPEVEEVLVLIWKTLNRICTKRLIPFLPDILETLEKDGHVQLSQDHRSLLLSMSAATADRLLQAHRYTHPHGLSTTKAGPLLKQQIPIRTFAQWDEAKPGFLEVDLVAHCGGRMQGDYLYTMTLTDVATGWTECLPLLNRRREAVLVAFQGARTLFPFPNYENMCASLLNLGNIVRLVHQDYEQAESLLQEGLLLARKIGLREWAGAALVNLAEVEMGRGHYASANVYLEECNREAAKLNIVRLSSMVRFCQGIAALSLGQAEQAVSFFHEMEQIVPHDDLELQTLLHYGQARLAASQGKMQQAQLLGEASAAAFENAGNYRFHEIRRWLKSIQAI